MNSRDVRPGVSRVAGSAARIISRRQLLVAGGATAGLLRWTQTSTIRAAIAGRSTCPNWDIRPHLGCLELRGPPSRPYGRPQRNSAAWDQIRAQMEP